MHGPERLLVKPVLFRKYVCRVLALAQKNAPVRSVASAFCMFRTRLELVKTSEPRTAFEKAGVDRQDKDVDQRRAEARPPAFERIAREPWSPPSPRNASTSLIATPRPPSRPIDRRLKPKTRKALRKIASTRRRARAPGAESPVTATRMARSPVKRSYRVASRVGILPLLGQTPTPDRSSPGTRCFTKGRAGAAIVYRFTITNFRILLRKYHSQCLSK